MIFDIYPQYLYFYIFEFLSVIFVSLRFSAFINSSRLWLISLWIKQYESINLVHEREEFCFCFKLLKFLQKISSCFCLIPELIFLLRYGRLMRASINLVLCFIQWVGPWITRPMGDLFCTIWKIDRYCFCNLYIYTDEGVQMSWYFLTSSLALAYGGTIIP